MRALQERVHSRCYVSSGRARAVEGPPQKAVTAVDCC